MKKIGFIVMCVAMLASCGGKGTSTDQAKLDSIAKAVADSISQDSIAKVALELARLDSIRLDSIANVEALAAEKKPVVPAKRTTAAPKKATETVHSNLPKEATTITNSGLVSADDLNKKQAEKPQTPAEAIAAAEKAAKEAAAKAKTPAEAIAAAEAAKKAVGK